MSEKLISPYQQTIEHLQVTHMDENAAATNTRPNVRVTVSWSNSGGDMVDSIAIGDD
jgi:hypothetical protein